MRMIIMILFVMEADGLGGCLEVAADGAVYRHGAR
jgi:hypothetical protein